MSIRVSLTVTAGPDEGTTYDFSEGHARIGRNRCEVLLSDKKISGNHCQLSIVNNQVILEDLGSTNGTFFGGNRLEGQQVLQNLDEFIVGLSKISVAIIEELSEFKRKNARTPPESSLTRGRDEAAMEATAKMMELPDPDAQYRDTGIQRIDQLINDEMDTFSKWDHPAAAETKNVASTVVKIRVHLNVRRGPEGLPHFTCTKHVSTLGRKDVDIRLNDLDCSRKHAAIEIINGDRAFIRDLASTNGTYVNGNRIAYQELKSGDLIQVGQSVLEVTIESDPT